MNIAYSERIPSAEAFSKILDISCGTEFLDSKSYLNELILSVFKRIDLVFKKLEEFIPPVENTGDASEDIKFKRLVYTPHPKFPGILCAKPENK